MLLISKTISLLLILFFITLAAPAQLPKEQIDSLIRELAKAKEDTNKVQLLRKLGNEVGYTDLTKALDYALQGYTLSQKLNYESGVGVMAYLLGITYTDLGDMPKADSFLNIAEAKFTSLGSKNQLAKVEHARGVLHYKQGNYWLASDFITKSVRLFEESKDNANALIAYQSLIASLGQVKNHDKAIELSIKALKMARDMKDTLSIGYSLQALVTDLIYARRFDEAANYLDDLKEVAETTIDQNLSAEAYSTLGMYGFQRKNYTDAIFHFKQAYEKAKQLGENYQVANHLNSLGQAQLELGQLEESRKSLMESQRLAKEYGNKRADYNASLSLSSYFKKNKRLSKRLRKPLSSS